MRAAERSQRVMRQREELLRDALALADLKAKVAEYEKRMEERRAGQPDDDPATVKAWRFRVVDLSQVPVEFRGTVLRPVDEAAVYSLIRDGVREIPGLEIALKKLYLFRRKQPEWDDA